MKKILILTAMAVLLFVNTPGIMAQYTSPGDPGSDPQAGGDPPLGGGAPIGGGMFILLGLGAAYGGKKLYHLFDEAENEQEINENQIIN